MDKDTPLVVFDLDDTLYKERDFVASGYRAVARRVAEALPGADADMIFNAMAAGPHGMSITTAHELASAAAALSGAEAPSEKELVEVYSYHRPQIALDSDARRALEALKAGGARLALITDGPSRRQWNKVEALGLFEFIPREAVVVSDDFGADKHSPVPFLEVERRFPQRGPRFYVGDNIEKDYLHPNLMGWTSVMLRDTTGRDVFPQQISGDIPGRYRPRAVIGSLTELLRFVPIASRMPAAKHTSVN